MNHLREERRHRLSPEVHTGHNGSADVHHCEGGRFLLGLGAASAAGYGVLAVLPTSNRAAHVLAFLGVMAALFALYAGALRLARGGSRRRAAFVVLGFGMLFRLLVLGAGLPAERPVAAALDDLNRRGGSVEPFLLYDNDLWRYLWDGHVLASGINPYSIVPEEAWSDEALDDALLSVPPWIDVLDNVSYQRYVSVYPPLTQYFFAGLASTVPGSALAARGALIAVDLALCALLLHALAARGRSPLWALAYAWNPAVVAEIAGSGHPDVLMMLPLTLAVVLASRGRALAAAGALGAAVLAKLAPLVVVPFAVRRRPLAASAVLAAVLVAGAAPLADGLADWWSGLTRFANRWTFNSGPWSSVEWIAERLGVADPSLWADGATRAALLAVVVFAWRRQSAAPSAESGLPRAAFVVLAAAVLASPAVMPWYVLWPLPLAVLVGNRSWLAFSGLAQLSYLFYIDPPWPTWWKWLEYGALAAFVWVELRRSKRGSGRP